MIELIGSDWPNSSRLSSKNEKDTGNKSSQSKLFLKTVAIPPPRPVLLSKIRKEQSGGKSSVKVTDSPAFIQVSMPKSISSACEVKKSWRMKVLFITNLTFKSAHAVDTEKSSGGGDWPSGWKFPWLAPPGRRRYDRQGRRAYLSSYGPTMGTSQMPTGTKGRWARKRRRHDLYSGGAQCMKWPSLD